MQYVRRYAGALTWLGMGLFIIGAVFLMQPWVKPFYAQSFTLMLVGLLIYTIFSHFESAEGEAGAAGKMKGAGSAR